MRINRFDLSNKTALITGAGGLLGYEHAAALVECNADIVMTDICIDSLNKAKNNLRSEHPSANVELYVMNVSSIESIKDTYTSLKEKGIYIDILINNAAIDPKANGEKSIDKQSRLENLSKDQWEKEISVGLTGAFLCSQVFGHAMSKSYKGGVIVNIASDLSVISPDQRLYKRENFSEEEQPVKPITYSVIKTGLIGLTKYLSTYWASKGVRCNAISPGGIFNNQDDQFVTRVNELIPLGRMADKSEYRAAIQFLCSSASSYMNGHNLIIDGGRSVI